MRCLQVSARLILALWLALAPVKAWAGSMTLLGAGATGPAGATVAYLAFATESSGSAGPITYSSLSFGAAGANRVLVAVFGARIPSANSISSATIGGVAATHAASTLSQNGIVISDIWYASVPTGTTGNVVVTYASSTSATGVQLYSVVTTTPTPSSSNAAVAIGGTSLSTTVTVPANGVGIAGGTIQSPSSPGMTNATVDNAGTITGSRTLIVGHLATGAVSPGVTNSISTSLSASAAAWGP